MVKVQADNIDGVYTVDEFDNCKIMSQSDFHESLERNPGGSIIGAELDDEIAAKIHAEYGIS